MRLNITNFNPDSEDDIKSINHLIDLLNDFKVNITTKYYKPYQNFLEKINKYITFMASSFQKELEEIKNEESNSEDDVDDVTSIGSISEYEQYENIDFENEHIEIFEDICEHTYEEMNNIYDIDIVKVF